MWTRVLTGALFAPATLFLMLYSPLLAQLTLVTIGIISLFELKTMLSRISLKLLLPLLIPYALVNLLMPPSIWSIQLFAFSLFAYFISLMCYSIYRYPGFDLNSLGANLLAALYPVPMLMCALNLRYTEHGHLALLLALSITWGCDTFAFFGGTLFGKHFILPNLSPKKTVEGSFFGVIGAVIAEVLFRYFFTMPIPLPPGVLAVSAAVLAQIGDMVASLLKRYTGVKDSGSIFPGHGGILDRFDAFFFVAFQVALILSLGGNPL